MSDIEETAKATQEIAKAAGKAIDAGGGVGRFLESVLGPAAREAGAMLHDSIRFHRERRLIRFQARFDELRILAKITEPPKPLRLSFGLALLEAASLEEEDTLQDIFAALLVNTTDPGSDVEERAAFISMIRELTPLDAMVLKALYEASPGPNEQGVRSPVYTSGLPERVATKDETGSAFVEPRPEVAVSLWNLVRLGCASPAGGWDGVSSVAVVNATSLGDAFLRACTVPSPERTTAPAKASTARPTNSPPPSSLT